MMGCNKKKGFRITKLKSCWFWVIIFLPFVSSGQPYGNEWIDFNQTYFRISVAENGIYRITYNNLVDAGFPISSVDPRRIQVFHRGEEQAIWIQGQQDASFDPSDYIEFYGVKNNGELDQELYLDPNYQAHQYYNLFSDSSAYFLTWKLSPTNGKRMAVFSENNVDALPGEVHHRHEIVQVFNEQYSRGRVYPEGGNSSRTWYAQYDLGEGWIGNNLQLGEFRDFVFDLSGNVNSATPPELNMALVGNNNRVHDVIIEVGPNASSLRTIATEQFEFYNLLNINETLAWSDVGVDNNLVVRIRVDAAGGSDVVAPTFIKVDFPQNFDMSGEDNKTFHINPNAGDKSYVEISNGPVSVNVLDITDPDNVRRIGVNNSGGDIDLVVNNTLNGRKLYVNSENYLSPFISKSRIRNLIPAQYSYVIISHQDLHQPSGAVVDPIKSYATYRASSQGGGFDTLVMDVDQLYDMYSYGEQTPLAIRKFVDHMLSGNQLQYVFLIGKSLSLETRLSGSGIYYRNSPQSFSLRNYVPTMGVPGSDIALIAGLGVGEHLAPVPIGRLNARNPTEVVNYLNKVIEMEAASYDDLWRKDVIHLSGGQNASELIQFAGFIDEFKNIIEGNFYGANVFTINKSDNSVVQLFNVSEQVNAGVSLITFYGHSASSQTDVEIGFVSNDLLGYANKGKYPTIIVNGCNAGDIFNTFLTFGEDWLREKDRGALNFMAHSTTGFVSQLRFHTTTFYNTAYGDSTFIGQSIGLISNETNARFLSDFGSSQKNIAQSQEVILQGDPANKLFGAGLPDYALTKENIFFQAVGGGEVSASDEMLQIGIILENYGITSFDSVDVGVSRTLSDGTNLVYDTLKFAPVAYQDTLYFDIPMGGKAFGNNNFVIHVDPMDKISELDELNNIVFTSFFIPLSGTNNLLPYNYAIVNKQPVKLVAQANDPFAASRNFLFEIDTVATYDSPFKQTNTIEARIIANWELQLLPDVAENDSTVYYWRTKYLNPLPGEDESWSEHSFTYIKSSPEGWSQTQSDQIKNLDIKGLVPNVSTDSWEFKETITNVEVTTHGNAHPNSDPINAILNVEDIPFIIGSPGNRRCRDNTINLLAFDHQSGLPYVVISFGNRDVSDLRRCGRVPQLINNFTAGDVVGNLYLDDYIDGVAPDDYVVAFSLGNMSFDNWPASTQTKIESLGITSTDITSMADGEPLIFLGRKGETPGNALVIKANPALSIPTDQQEISLNEDILSKFKNGSITTSLIGPAANWLNFINNVEISELPQTDVFTFDLFGVSIDGVETLLFTDVDINNLDLSTISANNFPYLRLKLNVSDETNQTAAMLRKWQVYYDAVPEGVLYLPEETVAQFQNDKQEGELVETTYHFENISDKTYGDSLVVNYELFNKDSKTTYSSIFKIKDPAPGQSTSFNLSFDTNARTGKNSLNLFVNPRVEPEQEYNNNILDIPNGFIVNKDTLNPLLDVTFDGIYILDGEIVSPTPLIAINMKDENQTLFKADTIGMTILLGVPCEECIPDEGCDQCQFKVINFSSPEVNWFEATADSDFKIEFTPERLEDGIYTLVIQAEDVSGNKSGINPYRIRFQVVNESTITNFYPYPNPFSTRTRFVYTLTGTEIPDQIKIQIMTVSGKIVREITQDELGPLRVGNSITDYAWDGKDEFGDQLANGVYLYRVIMGSTSLDFEHRETAGDKAFTKGFGKLYLLR